MILATLIAASLIALPVETSPTGDIFQFKLKNIDGKDTQLDKFKGKVLLVVNVASKCGLTPQYEALEKLHKSKKGEGFSVLGFPANEFGNQEPGTDEEIKAFCTGKYDVTFPMFSKIVVKGQGIHPLYEWLIGETGGKEIEWNFTKFLIGKQGQIIQRFDPRTKPDAPEVLMAIGQALASP